jgi:hypothetical protein
MFLNDCTWISLVINSPELSTQSLGFSHEFKTQNKINNM